MKTISLLTALLILPNQVFGAEASDSKTLVEKSDSGSAIDVVASGAHQSVSLGLVGQIPMDGALHLSLGATTTTINPANILDLKIGFSMFDTPQDNSDYWTQFFIGQTQIVASEAIGLGKKDSRFWFLEGFMGLGAIGVGYRFNFMNDEGGIYIRKTHIPKSLMYPFLALRLDL